MEVELITEIESILQHQYFQKDSDNEEQDLMNQVDHLFGQIMEIDNLQFTINDYIQECRLIRNTLYDLTIIMNNLIHKYLKQQKTIEKINYTIDYLTILKDLYETVLEILLNCQYSTSQKVLELTQKYFGNDEFYVKARTIKDINFYGLQSMSHVFAQYTLKEIIKIGHQYLSNSDGTNLKNKLVVYNSHLNILVRIFASAIDLDQNDLICLNRNHPNWLQIREISVYTKLSNNPECVQASYHNFMKAIRIGHATFYKKQQFKNKLLRGMIFLLSSMWYFAMDSRAKTRAIQHMCEMQIESAVNVMSMIEKPGIKELIQFGITSIKYNIKIYIDPVVIPLTLEYMNKQYLAGTLNKITNEKLEYVNKSIHFDLEQHNMLFKKNKMKLRIRILSSKDIHKINTFKQSFLSQITKQNINEVLETIIIHFHGGGFISMSSTSHQSYTREWSNQLEVPIFSVDYSLAPKFKYPNAVNDCWQAYIWILNYVQFHFNIIPKKIILAGDSAGGNLCCGITALAIKFGIKVPDGLLLSYPVLDLKMKFSPSHLYGLEDFLLNHTLMDICIDTYTGHPLSYEFDPFRSPNHLSDEIISKFPPVRILVGSKDPLLDHSHRLANQLLRNNKNVKMIVYEGMSHGFLSFYMLGGMKEASKCISDSILFLQELIQNKM